jgi:hypothetical protein
MTSSESSSPATPSAPGSPNALLERTEAYARQQPTQALSAAFGLGLVLALLPLGSLLGGLTRLAFLVLRPILIVLGLVKLYEQFDHSRPVPSESEPSEMDPI